MADTSASQSNSATIDVNSGNTTTSQVASNSSTGISSQYQNLSSGVYPTAQGKYTLPMPNVLSGYASYDYVLSLMCLSPDMLNFPADSYQSGNLPPLILKSASADPTNRFTIGGSSYDFFIKDLKINTVMGFDKDTQNTNALTLEFTVIEPYSMMQFITALQGAALQQGYSNYNDAAYLLMIQFRGETETGSMQTISGGSLGDPTKFIPFKLTTIGMKFDVSGATYNVTGYATGKEGLKDVYYKTKSNQSFSGKTVQEVLQSGPKSLQSVLNKRFQEQQKNNQVGVADQILILFPTQDKLTTVKTGQLPAGVYASSAISSAVNSLLGLGSSSPTSGIQSFTDTVLQKSLDVQSANSSTDSILVQDSGKVNIIGQAKVGFDVTRKGTRPFSDIGSIWDSAGGGVLKAKAQSDPAITEFMFNQDTSVSDIISKVISLSEYGVAALDPNNIDQNGFRPWHRIDMQVYHLNTKANQSKTNLVPKLIVYRVYPYGSHASKMSGVNAGLDTTQLSKQIAKSYNYLYTGLNTEIINFNVTVENAFISKFATDNFLGTQDRLLSNQNTPVSNKNLPNAVIAPVSGDNNNPKPANGAGPTAVQYADPATKNQPGGAGGGETQVSHLYKLVNDSLHEQYDMINFDMTIVGDPFYIANSGTGNYTAKLTNQLMVTDDGDVNFQSGEVMCSLQFLTPGDINQTTGLYDFTVGAGSQAFTGLWHIQQVTSEFRNGKFTQQLTGWRLPAQDNPVDPKLSGAFVSSRYVLAARTGAAKTSATSAN